MTQTRGILVLAMAAVLSGVPSSVFAANNELSAAGASPGSGTTATPFALSVEYHGGFDALSVTADAAGRAFPMLLAPGGTAFDGRWTTTVRLPAGTWIVRFAATASRGNNPVLDGPSLTVAEVASPTPVPSFMGGNNPGQQPTLTDPPNGGPGDPVPTDAPAAPIQAPRASDAALPAGTTSPAPAEPTPGDLPAGTGGGATAPLGGAPVTGSPATTMASSEAAVHHPTSGAARRGTADDVAEGSDPAADALYGPPSAVLPITAALGTLALLGSILALVMRRRRSAAETAPAGVVPSLDDEVTAALHRRTLRRSGRRPDADPIVASLGITDDDASRPNSQPRAGRRRGPPPA